ncbi:MAG: hypothetical protein U0835_24110 [Isosphaeraceae bacterium]
MNDACLKDFVAKWTRMRERYLANPDEYGVKNARLVELWRRFDGRCHLCGGQVPHPILELERIDAHNAPTADHATPKVDGGGRGNNLRLAHKWCNHRRGRLPLTSSLRRTIRAEASERFDLALVGEVHGGTL